MRVNREMWITTKYTKYTKYFNAETQSAQRRVRIEKDRYGENFKEECFSLFTNLKRQMDRNNETTQNALFKIIVEHIGSNINGDDEYWIYLLYT